MSPGEPPYGGNEMTDSDGKALWGRFKAAEPDALTLAAYAEGRLAAEAAAAVERWLALDPDGAADVAFARAAPATADGAAAERVATRAARLVSAQVLPFRGRTARRLAEATALAASVALIAYFGFMLGTAQVPPNEDAAELFDAFTVISDLTEGLQA